MVIDPPIETENCLITDVDIVQLSEADGGGFRLTPAWGRHKLKNGTWGKGTRRVFGAIPSERVSALLRQFAVEQLEKAEMADLRSDMLTDEANAARAEAAALDKAAGRKPPVMPGDVVRITTEVVEAHYSPDGRVVVRLKSEHGGTFSILVKEDDLERA